MHWFPGAVSCKMTDVYNSDLCAGDENSVQGNLDEVVNISLEEDSLNLFITPSNTKEVSDDEEDNIF